MTGAYKTPPAIRKMVEKGYFKTEEDALKEATKLLLKEYKTTELKKKLDETAEEIGKLKGKPLSELIEEIRKEEDEI